MSKLHQNIAIRMPRAGEYGLSLAIAACLSYSCLSLAEEEHGDWSHYSYDYANTNNNPQEKTISVSTAPDLVKAWETFNDDSAYPYPAPSGFMLEQTLGLSYPSAVVGVISPPLIQDGTIYYIDQLGTVFARDAETGGITNPDRHWTVHLADPDYEKNQPVPKLVPELYFTAPALTDEYLLVISSVHGRLHAVKRTGKPGELDYDPSTPGIDPFNFANAPVLASSMGESVIVKPTRRGDKTLYIRGMDVVLNDAVVGSDPGGMVIALDISDPAHPKEVWRTHTTDIDPVTNKIYAGGVSAGSGLAVDTKRGWVFGGTGQWTSPPYTGYPSATPPPGFVDRSDSVWAMDYRTGKFIWTNQFHNGDVFNLNKPEPDGPNTPGYRDADVLSPPVLFSAHIGNGEKRDLIGNGSKGGLYRAIDRDTGKTVWERQISKRSGLGGIQAGSAYANGAIYVAGFEGIDDLYSDANFNAPNSRWLNAFFATFSPLYWANAEYVLPDENPGTGMRVKVYSLDAATGKSNWHFENGQDYVELLAGGAMRHVSTANGLVYVTTTAGKLFILNAQNGAVVFTDQTKDLNAMLSLGLGIPHHAAMNGGSIISNGMVFVPSGNQNNPSGGMTAYKVQEKHK